MSCEIDSPVFLHFLNRELRETERVTFSDKEIYRFVLVASLMTNEFVYIGDAIIWECSNVFPRTISLLRKMEESGLACFVGTESDIDIFLSKRRQLYKHDWKRYPVYFTDDISKLPWAKKHRVIQGDTTAVLATSLFNIANGFDKSSSKIFTEKDKAIIARRLEVRRKRQIAVTYSLFKHQNFTKESELHLKRQIAYSFNKRYMDVLNGVIMTGIPFLSYYDEAQGCGLYFDYNLHYSLYQILGVISDNNIFSNEFIERIFVMRLVNSKTFRELLEEIKRIAAGCTSYYPAYNIISKRVDLISPSPYACSIENKLLELVKLSYSLCKLNPLFKKGYEKMASTKRKVLILAASPLEYRILRETARNNGFVLIDKTIVKKEEFSYAECQGTSRTQIFLARTDIGSFNSTMAINQLATELETEYVIMGGICAGMRRDEQEVGEILISKQLHDYDLSKKTENGRIPRGNTITPNRFLYDKFILESYDTQFTKIDCGLYISSNTLANSRAYIEELLQEYPDVKGYEMEGAGLMNACEILMDKWILVKAISDWGYDKDDGNQEMAAKNSYKFIFNTIINKIG